MISGVQPAPVVEDVLDGVWTLFDCKNIEKCKEEILSFKFAQRRVTFPPPGSRMPEVGLENSKTLKNFSQRLNFFKQGSKGEDQPTPRFLLWNTTKSLVLIFLKVPSIELILKI